MRNSFIILSILTLIFTSCSKKDEELTTTGTIEETLDIENVVGNWRTAEFHIVEGGSRDTTFTSEINLHFHKDGRITTSLKQPLTFGLWSFGANDRFYKINGKSVYIDVFNDVKLDTNTMMEWGILNLTASKFDLYFSGLIKNKDDSTNWYYYHTFATVKR